MTYDETIQFTSGQVVHITGVWRFGLPLNMVELDDAARVGERLDPQHIDHIDTGMEADRWWFGKYRLAANVNQDIYFVWDDSR